MKVQQQKSCQPLFTGKAQKAATPSFRHRTPRAATLAANQAQNLNFHA